MSHTLPHEADSRLTLAINPDVLDRAMRTAGIPTITALAAHTRIGRATLQRIKAGTPPSAETVAALLDALPSVTFEQLFDRRAS